MSVLVLIYCKVIKKKIAFCFALKCGDSQNPSHFVQHHITVSFDGLSGDKGLSHTTNKRIGSSLVTHL